MLKIITDAASSLTPIIPAIMFTVKAFVVTPKMTNKSIIFRGGYDKGYRIFIKNENSFICIPIYLLES